MRKEVGKQDLKNKTFVPESHQADCHQQWWSPEAEFDHGNICVFLCYSCAFLFAPNSQKTLLFVSCKLVCDIMHRECLCLNFRPADHCCSRG